MSIHHRNQLCYPPSRKIKQCGVLLPDLQPNWTSCFIFYLLTSISGNKTDVNACSVLLEGYCQSEQSLEILVDCISNAVSWAVATHIFTSCPGWPSFLFPWSFLTVFEFIWKGKTANNTAFHWCYMKCKYTQLISVII